MSPNTTPHARRDGDAWLLPIYVQPGARREGVLGVHGDALKLAVHAPPEKGKANKAVAEVIARALGVPPAAVRVVSGAASRRKTVRAEGASDAAVAAFLNQAAAPRASS